MTRTRRELLAATTAGLLAGLAGCGGGGSGPGTDTTTTEPTGTGLVFDGFEVVETDGGVVVEVVVTNPTNSRDSGTIDLSVSTENDTLTRERSVSVEGGETDTYSFEFEGYTRAGVLFCDGCGVDIDWKEE